MSAPNTRRAVLALGIVTAVVLSVFGLGAQTGAPAAITVDTPMGAPLWAYQEQELLRINAEVVQAYAAQHFDEKWHNKAPEEWGVGNGPDDIPEGLRSWMLAYALGGPESIADTWNKFYEGHLEQYANAKI